jgi:hypothetical protein
MRAKFDGSGQSGAASISFGVSVTVIVRWKLMRARFTLLGVGQILLTSTAPTYAL